MLRVSVLLESYACMVALREFNRERGVRSFVGALLEGRDPTLPFVLLEDLAAIAGLAVAFCAVLGSVHVGDARIDALGSIGVGVLLVVVAVFVARDVHGLLIGEGLTEENLVKARAALASSEGRRRVVAMRSLHLGPDEALLGAKVALDPSYGVAEVEAAIDRAELALRASVPILQYVYREPDSDGDNPSGPIRGNARPPLAPRDDNP